MSKDLLSAVNDMFDRAEPYHDNMELLSADARQLIEAFFDAFQAIGSKHMPGFGKRVKTAHDLGQQLMRYLN